MLINYLKMDMYRMVRQKSFYVCTAMLLILFNTSNHAMNNFLYYFPKALLLPFSVLLFMALFINEEITSGFIKHIYPLYQKKWQMLAERFLFTCVVYLSMWLFVVIIALILGVLNIFTMSAFSVFDYLAYIVTQMLVIAAVSSFVTMLYMLTRSHVITVLYVIGYSFSIFYALHMYLSDAFISYYEYTLYHIGITLPKPFDMLTYGKSLLIIITSAFLYNGITLLILKKRDIA